MSYEEMSDFEINKLVAKSLGIEVPEKLNPWLWKTDFCLHQLNGDGSKVEKTIVSNYCNDPSCSWSVIVDNKISLNCSSLQMDGYTWQAGRNFKVQHRDKNPLRAAMICFLKMKDVSDDN